MANTIDPLRFKAGVKQRIITQEYIMSSMTQLYDRATKRDSYTLSAMLHYSGARETDFSNFDKFLFFKYIDFSFSYRKYQDKLNFLRVVENRYNHELYECISYGGTFLSASSENRNKLQIADYSLFCRVPNTPLAYQLAKSMRGCFAKFFVRRKLSSKSLTAVINSYEAIRNHNDEVDTVDDISISLLRSSLRKFTRELWPLTGAFVLHALNRLSDPEDDLAPEEYELVEREAYATLLDKAFYALVLIRYLNDYKPASDFYDLNRERVNRHVNKKLLKKINLYKTGKYIDALNLSFSRGDRFLRICNSILNIYCMVAIQYPRAAVFDEIDRLYKLDKTATHFLNWGVMAQYIQRNRGGHDPGSILISILLTDPVISRRFPIKIGLAFGSGRANWQIFEMATNLVQQSKARQVSSFLRRFMSLQGNSRDTVFRYLADKSISDRLHSIFKTETSSLQNAYDNNSMDTEKKVSEMRIDILKFIRDISFSDRIHIQKLISEESALLRSFRFKEIYGGGRISLQDVDLLFEIESILNKEFNVKSLTQGDQLAGIGSDAFREHFARIVADRVVEHAVFSSDFSIDSVLSNNLRHGVIEPRILNALETSVRTELDGELVANLRAAIGASTKRFMDEWLTVTPAGPTVVRLHEQLANRILEIVSNYTDVDEMTLAEAAVDEILNLISVISKDAIRSFDKGFRSEVQTITKEFFLENGVAIDLRERIETVISAAFADVRSWLAVSSLQGKIESFSVLDLAHFEIGLHRPMKHTASSDAVLVETRSARGTSFRPTNHNIKFRGEYFEPIFTIIHNLVSNAYKHSGLASKTSMMLRIRIDGDDLVFQTENNFDTKDDATSAQDLVRSAMTALSDKDVKNTFKEGRSGFKKIKRLCRRAFADCQINIPWPSTKGDKVIISVRLVDAIGKYEVID
ncbi:hypothetical protein DC415_10355 [Agrobacterium tumefaciens]|uniref:Uncharacterized protein n=2 Tax=Rhizobium rhizogenes TaxID=359 RepID=A0AA92BYJ2_RHIRH|nr:hypothetical protein DC430_24250 [Rhizobium rhizogenes]PVE65383.1 hypothetical protein DC415_10355 [Agrobacterium tumefaciens]PVE75447.1 hypothetical protein DCP16_10355 [Sphingomonas sp. TPD3009]